MTRARTGVLGDDFRARISERSKGLAESTGPAADRWTAGMPSMSGAVDRLPAVSEAAAGARYEPIAMSSESTVVAEFVPDPTKESGYQSEADLERALIAMLQEQAYEYLRIASEADLVANLRVQLEALNGITFSDVEW